MTPFLLLFAVLATTTTTLLLLQCNNKGGKKKKRRCRSSKVITRAPMHRMAAIPSTARTDSEGDNLGAPADIMDPSEVGKISRGDKTYGAKTAKPMSTKHGKKTQRNDQSKLMTAKKSMMDVHLSAEPVGPRKFTLGDKSAKIKEQDLKKDVSVDPYPTISVLLSERGPVDGKPMEQE